MEEIEDLLDCSRYGELADIEAFVREKRKEMGITGTRVDFLGCKGSRGNSMLHMAAANGHLPLVEYLINSGPLPVVEFVNMRNDEGNTPLHWACLNGHLTVASALLEHGADGKLRNYLGRSCLYYAQNNNHEQVVTMLLQRVDYEAEAGSDSDSSPDQMQTDEDADQER